MLNPGDTAAVLRTMVAGFSDYLIKLDIDEDGYRHKFALDGVEYDVSVGVFEKGELIGVTMNCIGEWRGKRTVYDAGTVVLPSHRRKGASKRMFEHLLPNLSEMGFDNYLLEVMSNNEPAVRLYESFGFRRTRRLGVFYRDRHGNHSEKDKRVEIRHVSYEEIATSELVGDEGLAWQNKNVWISRSEKINYGLRYVGLFNSGSLIGLGIVSPKSGKVLRVCISDNFRRSGFGTLILNQLEKLTPKPLIFLNIDLEDQEAVRFLESANCVKKIEQFEMELEL